MYKYIPVLTLILTSPSFAQKDSNYQDEFPMELAQFGATLECACLPPGENLDLEIAEIAAASTKTSNESPDQEKEFKTENEAKAWCAQMVEKPSPNCKSEVIDKALTEIRGACKLSKVLDPDCSINGAQVKCKAVDTEGFPTPASIVVKPGYCSVSKVDEFPPKFVAKSGPSKCSFKGKVSVTCGASKY